MRTKKRPPTHEMHTIKFALVIHSYVPATLHDMLMNDHPKLPINCSVEHTPVNHDFHQFLKKMIRFLKIGRAGVQRAVSGASIYQRWLRLLDETRRLSGAW